MVRVAGRQKHRDNFPGTTTAEEYYRRSIYYPIYDEVIRDLDDRFSKECLNCFDIRILLPHLSVKLGSGEEYLSRLKVIYDQFRQILPNSDYSESSWEGECATWRMKWLNDKEKKKAGPLEAMESARFFPNVQTALQILATLPVSVATAERTFSCLKRTKTWLSQRMGEERLNGLCLLNMHRDLTPTPEEVMVPFSKCKHRLDFKM